MAAILDGATQPDPAARDSPAVIGAPTPYIQRKIDVTISLGTGNFGESGQNVVTLRGYRCSVTISRPPVGGQGYLNLRIWGLSFKLMKQLATYGSAFAAERKNFVQIDAGDDLAGMTQIFIGNITNAYFDGTSQPDVAFQVTANEGTFARIKPAPPISVAGLADVSTLMQSLAQQMGVRFEDHGVTAKLRDVYYPGTAQQQASRIAEHAGINWTLENGMLAIWPRGQGRDTGSTPLITPLAGMKDYPSFNQQGVIVSCLFRVLKLGQRVAIKSSLWGDPTQKDTGSPGSHWENEIQFFFVYTYTYSLESELPNGPWFNTFMASYEPI